MRALFALLLVASFESIALDYPPSGPTVTSVCWSSPTGC